MSEATTQPGSKQHSPPVVEGRMLDRSTVFTLALLAVVLVLTLLVYWAGLSGPLLLDDLPQLNGLIAQGASDTATLIRNYIVSTSGPLGRPVAMASFISDAVTHGPDIWWWKYNNVMLHLINGLLVFWLTALLAQATLKNKGANPWTLGIIAAGFWLLHPLQVSTVLYTVQRMTELSTLFVLAGLVFYARGRLLQETSVGRGWLFIGLGFGLFFPLAVLSKESGLLFPVYCSLLEVCVFQFRGSGALQRQVRAFHWVLLAGYVSIAVFALANFSSVVLEGYATRDFTIHERVLTQFRVMVMYLGQILLPVQSNMGFFHDDVSVSTGLLSPVTTLFSALVLIALLASSYVMRIRAPLYTFGVLFFFASHLLESSIFGLELMFEHRNYLGLLGILIAAMSVIPLAIDHRKGLVTAVVIGLCGFSFLTWQRSLTWSEPIRMYEYMYYAHPESGRLNLTISNIYALAGDFDRARRSLAKVGTGPGPGVHSLFLDCLQYQKVNEASLSRILQRQDGLVDAHATSSAQSLLGEVLAGRCRVSNESLLTLLDHLLAARTRSVVDRQSVMFTKARLLEAAKRVDSAVEVFLAAQELSDSDALPLYLAARTLADDGRPDEAQAMLMRASEMEKNTRIRRLDIAQATYLAVGRIYAEQDQLHNALAVYSAAIVAMPGQALFYFEKAELLLRMQQYDDVGKLLAIIQELELADIDQYNFSLLRLEARLQQHREESSGS